MALCTGLSSDNDGVNELAINLFTDEDNKVQVVQQVKYGRLRVRQRQNLRYGVLFVHSSISVATQSGTVHVGDLAHMQ